MTSTRERIEVLGRMRKRLAWLSRFRPLYRQTIKDTRVIIDGLEVLILIDIPQKGEMKK